MSYADFHAHTKLLFKLNILTVIHQWGGGGGVKLLMGVAINRILYFAIQYSKH